MRNARSEIGRSPEWLVHLVVDASALIDYVLPSERHEPFARILQVPDTEWHIPSLCDIEMASFFCQFLRSGKLEKAHAAAVIADYLALPLTRHPHENLLIRILELRENFSAYDATYVALAETLEATLVTADQALARAVRRHLKLPVLP